MKNKQLSILFLLSLSISIAISAAVAEERKGPHGGHHGPQLTDAQKTCLDGKLGPKDSGNRPSKEAFEAAMSACGVEKPKDKDKQASGDAAPQQNGQDSSQSEQ